MKKKPKIRYVDMCIYIDKHIYEPDHNVELIFEYLQMLFYALAFKKRFFNKEKDYDDYSLYAATRLYVRLTSKNQFLSEDNPKYIPKVKSVLNYIKSILYPLKVDFMKENFKCVISDEYASEGIVDSISCDLRKNIYTSTSSLLQVDTIDYLKSIPKVIYSFLKETPYSNDKVMIHRLYISCLITLLRSITLSNENYIKLFDKETNNLKLNAEELQGDLIIKELINSPVAWHLDEGMENYIYVITNKIRKLIVSDIRFLMQYYEPSEEIIKDILMNPLIELNEENNE